jgi:hypothetical protein
MIDAKARVLKASGIALPWTLGIAFVFGDYTYIGAILTVALCLWYSAWNWRAVLSWKWAMMVLGFFAALALKDCVMWLAGAEQFISFAKSGSRIISLFGAAAILSAYEDEKAEQIYGNALGLFAAVIAVATLLIRMGKLPALLNPNSFGMDCCWFPLYLVIVLRRRGGAKLESYAALVALAGGAIVALEAFKNSGSRTAPIAYVVALLFIYLARPLGARRLSIGVFILAIASIGFFSMTYLPNLDNLLSHRQELWNAYITKGAERPFLGWGYIDPTSAKSLLGSKLNSRPIYIEFMAAGYGPHNSFLAMFFENGAIAIVLYTILLIVRAAKAKKKPDLFDVSFIAFIVFMSSDAMNAGGITFLGFFLGTCLLAGGRRITVVNA